MKLLSFFFSLLILLSLPIIAQTGIVDSLKSELNSSVSDSDRVNILNALSKNYLYSNLEEALNYSNMAKDLSEQIGYSQGLIESLINFSGIEEKRGKYDSAVKLAKEAIELSQKQNLPVSISEALSNLGVIYFTKGDYVNAVESFLSGLEIAKRIKDDVLISKFMNNIGSVYYRSGDRKNALKYYKESLPVNERLNKYDALAVLNLNIGAIYRDDKNFGKAKDCFLQSIEFAKQTGDSLRMSFALNNLSGLYFDIEDYETALKYLLESYRMKERLGSKPDIASSLSNIAALYSKLGNTNKALQYCKKSLEMSEELNSTALVLKSYQILSQVYSENQDYTNAYKYLVLFNSLKDSLDALGNSKIAEIQAGHETEKIITENEQLQLENEYRSDIIFYQRIIVIVSVIMIALASIFASVFLKQKNKLDRLNSLKDNFFSVVAHDLRNHVNSIQNITGVLANEYDEIDEKDKAELTGILGKSANMLNGLISNLFTWSTFQQGITSYNPEKYNITQALEETTDVLNHNAEDKNIEIKYSSAADLYVEADKEMIDSVILNLITNAIKFSPSNTIINVSVYKKENFAEFLVEDNGVGIPEDIQKTLFNLGNNKSSRGTSGEKGSGLGLIICKEFVEKNKGTIRFESEVDKGTKFFVSLPLA